MSKLRFSFICGVKVGYYSNDDNDKEVVVRFEPQTIIDGHDVGFHYQDLINGLKLLNLSKKELDSASDYIMCNYVGVDDWCVAEPEYLFCTIEIFNRKE